MIFNSFEFLIFAFIVFILYWMLRQKHLIYQNLLILISSYIFYGWWDWRFLYLIGFSTILDFTLGINIESAKTESKKKILLTCSILINISILGVFKYYNFFISSLQYALTNFGINIETWSLNIILPVGISFYTFQTLTYTIDIYRGKIKSTRDIINYAAFISFFPQLLAGPIGRASELLPQFSKARLFKSNDILNGLTLISYGLFKKIVIADRLAVYTNNIFNNIDNANTLSLTIAIIFFSFQIYCDFSGYSLIAKGVAKLFGFEIMTNFQKPYLATSLPDFWRRWHISLSTWFRDYLYIPLGGNRVSIIRNYINILVVFLVSGLWHGANLTYIIWGGIHGFSQIIYSLYIRIIKPSTNQFVFRKYLNILFVYSIVCFAWIFFKAHNIDDAFLYVSKLFEFDFTFNLSQICAEQGPLKLFLNLFVIGLLFITYLFPEDLKFKNRYQYLALNASLIFLIITLGVNGESEFIYFQF